MRRADNRDLTPAAGPWLAERLRLTARLAARAARRPSPRAVHDLRVSCRRLRETIALLDEIAGPPSLSAVDRAARRLARAVRRLRELDVAVVRVGEIALPLPPARAARVKKVLVAALRDARRARARGRAARIERRASRLRAEIAAAVRARPAPGRAISRPRLGSRGAGGDAADVDHAARIATGLGARLATRRAEVERLFARVRPHAAAAAVVTDAAPLHAVRVAIKRWRYAAEIARALGAAPASPSFDDQLRRLQSLGGDCQDFGDLITIIKDDLPRATITTGERRTFLGAARASYARAARAFIHAVEAAFDDVTVPARPRPRT